MPGEPAKRAAEFVMPPGIRHLLLAFVDLRGELHTWRVPAAALERLCARGLRFTGAAGIPAEAGLRIVPALRSLSPLPWSPGTAWLACSLRQQGRIHPLCPRGALQRQVERAAAAGFCMQSGVECEFYLLRPDAMAVADDRDVAPRPCYEQAPLVRCFDLIRELLDAMEQLGWAPCQAEHEDANGQFELNWSYDEALRTADQHVFFRYMVKVLAARRGMRADFTPQPFAQQTGNGCHAHVSLWDVDGRRNLFLDPRDLLGLAQPAYYFIGGLLRHTAPLLALLAPTAGSYQRLHAPLHAHGKTWTVFTLTYSGDSRLHAIRVPAPGRLELRLADGAANPYLLQAGLLAAGLDGIAHCADPGRPAPADNSGLVLTPELLPPATLEHALQALADNRMLRTALGAPLVDACIATQTQLHDC